MTHRTETPAESAARYVVRHESGEYYAGEHELGAVWVPGQRRALRLTRKDAEPLACVIGCRLVRLVPKAKVAP
jgi:hypothetical protein